MKIEIDTEALTAKVNDKVVKLKDFNIDVDIEQEEMFGSNEIVIYGTIIKLTASMYNRK